MQNRMIYSSAHLDRMTSASVRSAIGERLRQNLRPEKSGLPSHLQALLDEMERQDRSSAGI